jgi:hypothetical protein
MTHRNATVRSKNGKKINKKKRKKKVWRFRNVWRFKRIDYKICRKNFQKFFNLLDDSTRICIKYAECFNYCTIISIYSLKPYRYR